MKKYVLYDPLVIVMKRPYFYHDVIAGCFEYSLETGEAFTGFYGGGSRFTVQEYREDVMAMENMIPYNPPKHFDLKLSIDACINRAMLNEALMEIAFRWNCHIISIQRLSDPVFQGLKESNPLVFF